MDRYDIEAQERQRAQDIADSLDCIAGNMGELSLSDETTRDLFAAAYIVNFTLATPSNATIADMAATAYQVADAMMRARKGE